MAKKIKLHISDAKMLELMDTLKSTGKIRFKKEFSDSLGMLKQHMRQIVIGKQHFTALHIKKACEVFNVNANWVLDIEPNMYRKPIRIKTESPPAPIKAINKKKL